MNGSNAKIGHSFNELEMGASALRGNTKSSEMLTRSDDAELAERFGAAIKLNRFACQQAIQAIRDGARFGSQARLFVRLSVASLLDDIAQILKAELSMGSIDAKLLFLEFDLQDIGRELAACNRRFEALRARRVDLPECRAQAAAFARDVAKA